MARLNLLLLLAWVFLHGCGDAVGEPSLECADEVSVVVGETLVRIHDLPSSAMCRGNLEAIDSHAKWVAKEWGSASPLVEYNLHESKQSSCWPCPSFASACAGENILHTTRVPDYHELAHASHGPLCSAFLEEGWATLYSGPFENGNIFGTFIDAIVSIESQGHLAGDYYPLAAKFVAFIIDRWGMDIVIELCGHSLATIEEFESAIGQVLGMTPSELFSEMQDYPEWTLGQLRQDRACETTSTAPVYMSSETLALDLSCEGQAVEGKAGVRTWTHAVVELPEPGNYEVSMRSSFEVEVDLELRSCTREGMASLAYDHVRVAAQPEPTTALESRTLDAGFYIVRVMVSAEKNRPEPAPNIELTLSPSP